MRRWIASVIVVLVLAPAAFASDSRDREPRFDIIKIIKRLVLVPLDEILTGSKP